MIQAAYIEDQEPRPAAWQRLIDGQWVWLIYLPFYFIPWFWSAPDASDMIGSAIGVIAFLLLYWWGLASNASDERILACAAAVLMLSFGMALFGGSWGVFSIYAAAMVPQVRQPRRAGGALSVYALAILAFGLLTGQHWFFWALPLVLGVMVGIGNMSRTLLERKNAALVAAQSEVRTLAELAERERIARDLHDLLGRSLTLVAVQADLAVKLSSRDPDAAAAEMRAVAETARAALAEVRGAVAGLQRASLPHELDHSCAALRAASIDPLVSGAVDRIEAQAGAVLAMALREAVTNVIRHADARACRIELTAEGRNARLIVADDGHGLAAPEGNGLRGMRARLAAAGGKLQIGSDTGGTRLEASVPMERA
jgi:two-component system, NarL family, sensor histidine kinase DesK